MDEQPDLAALSSDLHGLKETREDDFAQRERILARKREVSKSIREHIAKIKELREKRNACTQTVRQAKEGRTKLNDVIKEKIGQLKQMSPAEERQKGDSPRFLQEQIQRMEFKIEHEGVSFEKEQQLMKAIKDMKRKLDVALVGYQKGQEARDLSTEVHKLKDEADAVHHALQQSAKESQDYHTQLLALSAELDKLKLEEIELQNAYEEIRKRLDKDSTAIKEKATVLHEIHEEVQKKKKKQHEAKVQAETRLLKDLEQEVKEKIKQKKKLTTEDLLILQKTDREE